MTARILVTGAAGYLVAAARGPGRTGEVLTHLGGKPYQQFELKQKAFEHYQGVGYRDFMAANAEVDALFIDSVRKLIRVGGTPTVLAIAGPTAAGKTEIVVRLREAFEQDGQRVTSIELDNFVTDREYREQKGIFTQGKQALHFELFKQSLVNITQGKKISIPRYDFVFATSSHDLDGHLKPDGVPIEIEPADIIFIEGNFPFLIQEVVHLIGIKVVYLTDDPVRMKRKWKRDIDYRKKYEPTYFRNRFPEMDKLWDLENKYPNGLMSRSQHVKLGQNLVRYRRMQSAPSEKKRCLT